MKYQKRTIQQIADLITMPVGLYRQRYPNDDADKSSINRLKKYYLKRLKENDMEKDPQQNKEGYTRERLDRIAELLERSGVSLDDVAKVNRVNVYQGYLKNAEGEFETQDLYSVQYTPKPSEITEDMFVRQAAPTVIRPTKSKARKSRDKTAIILPDIQAGFRIYEDGVQDPTHDEKAISVALQIIKDVQPDQIILNGDNLDLPQFGRYAQEYTFGQSLNPTLDYVHKLLGQIRANSPDSKIVYLAGNHEVRLNKYLMQYAERLYGVRQAGNNDKVLTIPFLLNLASVEVDYKSGYPANEYWINDRLKAVHGNIVRAAGRTAAAYADKEDTSTFFGHVHRHEYAVRTARNYRTARYIIAQSFGCLARIDGAVPSYGSGIDEVTEEPIPRTENWQHGLGFVEYRDGDTPFDTTQITIQTFNDYRTNFNGKLYLP